MLGIWGLIYIRKELGLIRQISAWNTNKIDRQLDLFVEQEFQKGNIKGYDCSLLYYHFRTQGHIISRQVQLF